MKEMLEKVKGNFAQSGYRKRRNSFYKIEDGFYKLINFQKGAYGDGGADENLDQTEVEESACTVIKNVKKPWSCISSTGTERQW